MRNRFGKNVGLVIVAFTSAWTVWAQASGNKLHETSLKRDVQGAVGERVFDVPANENPPVWEWWDVGGDMDLAHADGVEFDFYCDNVSRFGDFFLRLYTTDRNAKGQKGFHIRFQPTACGKWCHIRLRKVDVTSRLRPCGNWADVKTVRLIGARGGDRGPAVVKLANLKPLLPTQTEAVVVLPETLLAKLDEEGKNAGEEWSVCMVRRMQDAFDALGVSNVAVSDIDLANRGLPEGVKLVSSFQSRGLLANGACSVLMNFSARGGKQLWTYGVPMEIRRYLREHPEAGVDAGHSLEKDDNRDVPAYARRLEPVLTKLVPAWTSLVVRARAEMTAKEAQVLAKIRMMPGADGEERVVDCHEAYGPWEGTEWAEAAKFVKDCGFTALSVNVCTGPTAWYPTKVLRPAREVAERGDSIEKLVKACRANGLKAVGWRCCFVVRDHIYPQIADEYEKAGRMTVDDKLKTFRSLLCPVNPLNRHEDVAAFAEMAGKGLDVVAMDFIRYASGEYCCCPACRAAFEAKRGKPVGQWPEDLFKDEAKGGCQKQWCDFRVEAITSHIREIRAAITAVNPNVELWSSCFPKAEEALVSEGQDWRSWCREGLIDRLDMMDYAITPAAFEGLIVDQRKFDLGSFKRVGPTFGPVRWNAAGTVAHKALYAAQHIAAIRRQGYRTFTFFQLTEETKPVLEILAQGPLKITGN